MFCNFANKVAPLLEKSVYKFLILGCSLGLTLLVRIPQEYIFVNAWSLNYQRILFGEKIPTESIWSPPEHHHRAPLWLARLALEQDDPSMAQALVVPLLATGEPLALRILGQVFLAQGDLNAAVQSWVKIGDFFSLIQTAKLAESEGRLQDAELAYRGGWLAVPDAGTLPLANFLLNTKNDPVAAEEVLRISLERVQLPDLNWLRALGNSLRAQARWDEALKIYQTPTEGACVQVGEGVYVENEGSKADVYNNDQCNHSPEPNAAICDNLTPGHVCYAGTTQYSIQGTEDDMVVYVLDVAAGCVISYE